jgi:hypothetical protein
VRAFCLVVLNKHRQIQINQVRMGGAAPTDQVSTAGLAEKAAPAVLELVEETEVPVVPGSPVAEEAREALVAQAISRGPLSFKVLPKAKRTAVRCRGAEERIFR